MRPTVVYGPFCGVWTDRIFEAFLAGDVGYRDLAGRIQPLNGADLSRFILHRLRDFRAGFYNIAGPHSMSWLDFFEAFREIANHGALRRLDDRGLVAEGKEGLLSFYSSNLRELMHAVRGEPAFDRMAVSIARHLPERAVQSIRGLLLGRGEAAAPKVDARYPAEYLRRFFGEDRLVSSARATADFPDFVARPLAAFGDQLRAYFRFRFHDDDFI